MTETALPQAVRDLMAAAIVGEFATISAAGVPIDTPCLIFEGADGTTLDAATGLAYPAKAERARRNPTVGYLLEGMAGEPIVSIGGHAAVRDADLQANCNRYIAETGWARPGNPPWDQAQRSIWYWSRIIMEVTPLVVRWWDSAEAMDGPPREWRAAPSDLPRSDPAPTAPVSKAADWSPPRDWRELAGKAMAKGVAPHLTLFDGEGYPLPFRCRSTQLVAEGFELELPAGAAALLRAGQATLCFDGRATFVGAVDALGVRCLMRVERCLPVLPLVNDPAELWEPAESTRTQLLGRLGQEAARRGQPVPVPPAVEPAMTAGAQRRMARISRVGR